MRMPTRKLHIVRNAGVVLAAIGLAMGCVCSAQTAAEKTYSAGELTLDLNQSISAGGWTLLMGSDCRLTLTNPVGQKIWQSSPGPSQCLAPQASFDSTGNLVVSSESGIARTTLWQSNTAGSSKLVLSSASPYLEILNSDTSPAWRANGPLTMAGIDPAMTATIGVRGSLYSQLVARSSGVAIAPGDQVDNFQSADGSEVRVLVKAPAPASIRVYHVPKYPMQPNQRVLDYLAAAIAYAGGANPDGTIYSEVAFPKATYEVEDFPGCDDARGSNGNNHWQISYATDLVIDGQGSTLNFNGLCEGIELDWVQRVVFRNFTIDWPNVQLAALGTVKNVNENSSTMELVIDPAYKVDKNTVIEALTSWDRANNYWSLTTPQEDEGIEGYATYKSGQTFQVPDWAGFQNGDTVIARYFAGESAAVVINDSQDVSVENVNVYGSLGSAFIFGLGRGFRLSNSQVTRRPGRLISIAGDAVHMAGDVGDILIEGNMIGYQGDDGLNLNATMWCNSSASGSNAQPCNPSLAGPSGGAASGLDVYSWWEDIWLQGDRLGYFTSNFLLDGDGTVKGAATNPHVSTNLSFSNAAPAGAQFLADLSYAGARYIVRNNTFLHNRARGVLLQTSNGLVSGNTFDGQTMHSIYVTASPFWGEGPGAQNLIVANNIISKVGNYIQDASNPATVLGAVVVAAEDNQGSTIPSKAPLHQNLIFSGNTVADCPGPAFFLSTANNVILRENSVEKVNQAHGWLGSYGSANSDGSIVVTEGSNFFEGNRVSRDSGPISVDKSTTTGIVEAGAKLK